MRRQPFKDNFIQTSDEGLSKKVCCW